MGGEGTRGYKCGGRRGGLIERKSKDTIRRWLELEGFRRFSTLALPPLRQGGHTPYTGPTHRLDESNTSQASSSQASGLIAWPVGWSDVGSTS